MKILLRQWAKNHFSPPPSDYLLREMRKAGRITPAPILLGGRWYVEEEAQLVESSSESGDPVVDQIAADFGL